MRNNWVIIIPFVLGVVACTENNSGGNDGVYHSDCTVRFVNYDGQQLYQTTVQYGDTAVYRGPTPTRPDGDGRSYVFKGWDRNLNNVTYSFTTRAQFDEIIDTSNPTYTNAHISYRQYDGHLDIYGVSDCQEETLYLPDIHDGQAIKSVGGSRTMVATTYDFCRNIMSKKIKFPVEAEAIGYKSFYKQTTLEELVFPNALKTIGEWAFRSCESVKTIKFNRGLKSIGELAFDNAFYKRGSYSIYIPDSVSYIGYRAFANRMFDDIARDYVPINMVFYCEASSKPAGWDEKWNWYEDFHYSYQPEPSYEVHWGVPFPY